MVNREEKNPKRSMMNMSIAENCESIPHRDSRMAEAVSVLSKTANRSAHSRLIHVVNCKDKSDAMDHIYCLYCKLDTQTNLESQPLRSGSLGAGSWARNTKQQPQQEMSTIHAFDVPEVTWFDWAVIVAGLGIGIGVVFEIINLSAPKARTDKVFTLTHFWLIMSGVIHVSFTMFIAFLR